MAAYDSTKYTCVTNSSLYFEVHFIVGQNMYTRQTLVTIT